MYESPITQNIADIATQIRKAQDGRLIYEVQQAIGYEIDKEELIKALRYDRNQYEKGYEDGRKDNEWIPVSERLPKERGLYIVTEKEFRIDDREHKGKYSIKVEQVEYYNGRWQRANFFEVIAWKPLPEPYKEISEGKA